MPLGLLALALCAFGIGLTEFVIAGLLPEVSRDLGVDEATAGTLISGYALGVAVGAVGITAAVTRLPRKPVLVGLMVLFVAGNLVSALAPGYGPVMVGRVLAALCHGAFFGIGAVVAGRLVAPGQEAKAVSILFTGLTLANVLGVPMGTFVGQQFGWRATFWVITGIGVVALAGVAAFVPVLREASGAPSLRRELQAFRSGQVWLTLVVTALAFGGVFGAFTYMAFTLTEVSGFASGAVPWLLVVFGGGLFVGNLAGGRLAARSLDATLVVMITGLALAMAVFALTAANPVAAVAGLLVMAFFGFAIVPALQTRPLRYAGDAPTLASATNVAAFNVGNAVGPAVGGAAITAGLGYTAPLWVGALFAALAVVVFLPAAARARRADHAPASAVPDLPVPAGSR